jgi:hypothetical protein
MSVARGFGLNGKSIYQNVCKPMDVWCNFIVDSTNGNGLGIRSLKSNGYINNVFMHTSATPGTNNGQTNPNPAVGYAWVNFKNNFNYYLGGFEGFISPLTSTSTTSVTAGNPYVITSLGSTTLAQWQAAGLPAGFTPTVGQGFIALETGAIGGSGTVGLPSISAIQSVSVVGDPNQTLNNASIAQNGGAWILIQFAAPTSSSVTTLTATAPSNGTVVGFEFSFDGSSVTIDGL